MDELTGTDRPLVVYCYRQLSDSAVFCDMLKTRFRDTGHTRKIEFRFWDCYKTAPGTDGDLYVYDGMALSALAENGFIRRLPDIIDTSGVFEWVLNGSKVKRQIFGIPFMLCANVLICKNKDRAEMSELAPGDIAAPMRSMIGEYYLFSYFNSPRGKEGSLDTLMRLRGLIGGIEAYDRSRIREYDGIARFKRGECRYLLGFSEDLRFLPPDEYIVRPVNISDGPGIELPFNYVNYISVGARTDGERLLDCLDIMEIITDKGFFFDYCTADGQLRYFLPANERLYASLTEKDGIYEQLYSIAANEYNLVLRYGKNFYEEFPRKTAELHALLGGRNDGSVQT